MNFWFHLIWKNSQRGWVVFKINVLVHFNLSDSWSILDSIISNVFFISNPWKRLVLVNFSNRNWSWWHLWFLWFILMSMNDNISSGLNGFFGMRMLGNDNISIYSDICDIVVISIYFNTCVVLGLWININLYL